jgi:DNA-binding beta-propeller fold protein YncE
MNRLRAGLLGVTAAAVAAVLLVAPGLAQAAAGDPFMVFFAPKKGESEHPVPPGTGFSGPCGLTVDGGKLYVSDYNHDTIDSFLTTSPPGYQAQLAKVDPLDGPCGIDFDAEGHLWVNDYHRSVIRYSSFPAGAGAVVDEAEPTGVAVDPNTDRVYVDDRTYISVYLPNGEPVLNGAVPLRIGAGNLGEGYGMAASQGRLYVADAATNTVKVYVPEVSISSPVEELTGPGLGFASLRDSAVAISNANGKIYVADNLQRGVAEEPEAAIDVFSPSTTFLGQLKYRIVDANPPGLTVGGGGEVYVTSGNTAQASVYGYPADSEVPASLPPERGCSASACGATAGERAEAVPTAEPAAPVVGAAVPSDEAAGGGSAVAAPAPAPSPRPDPAPARRRRNPSSIVQKGSLRVRVESKLSPRNLPREGSAPVGVSIGWNVATTDGSAPPKLQQLQIEINRHGHFDAVGLPVCPIGKIQPASSARALANCRSALVGEGKFSAEVSIGSQEPYEAGGRLLVFNGERHGKPVLLGQIYSPHPFATSFVIVFGIEKRVHGAYGTTLSATLPKQLLNWGNLTGIEMTLSRRYGFKGTRKSYVTAGCPAPKGFGSAPFSLARTSFSFTGGASLSSTIDDVCKVRK